MAQKNNQWLSLPGENQRETWHCHVDGTWKISQTETTFKEHVLVLEAVALDSAPFWARTSQEGDLAIHEVTSLHWETLGLENSNGSQSWTCWKIAEKNGHVLVGTVALAREFSSDSWLEQMPKICEISPQLYPIPSHQAALWKDCLLYTTPSPRD